MKEETRNNPPAVIPFHFEAKEIRVIQDENGDPLFLGKDVAELLEYADTDQAIRKHCKRAKLFKPVDSTGLNNFSSRGMMVIPESDLYRLIMKSQMPDAERFQDWVVEEVLPAIRKTGSYAIPNGPHRKAFDASIAKRYALGIKIARDTLKMSRDFGINLYEAKIRACEEATKISGIDFTHLIPLIPKEEKKTKLISPESNANLAGSFFEALNDLPKKEREKCVQQKDDQTLLRLSLALKTLKSHGHRLVHSKIMKALKEHPAFIDSNFSCRAHFGSMESTTVKAWVFDSSLLSASSAGKEGGQS